jgi:hypothetical protein
VCNILNESALYAVFALMKARIKKELEDSEANHSAGSGDSYLWRQRVLVGKCFESTNARILFNQIDDKLPISPSSHRVFTAYFTHIALTARLGCL